MKNIISRSLPFFIAAIFLAAIGLIQFRSDLQIKERDPIEPGIIPATAFKISDLGLHSAAASLMWIYSIQQLNSFPHKFGPLIRIVNDLDPKFSYPYAFSTLILPEFGFIDDAISIAEAGIRDSDPDWRIPYYLATTYHIFLKDRVRAAHYFDVAAKTPGAFDGAKTVAARYGTSTSYRDQTKSIWTSIYETTDDALIKENALNHMIQLEIIELLEKSILIYRQKYNRYPQDLKDLVAKKIIKEIPSSPFGVQFYLVNGQLIIR